MTATYDISSDISSSPTMGWSDDYPIAETFYARRGINRLIGFELTWMLYLDTKDSEIRFNNFTSVECTAYKLFDQDYINSFNQMAQIFEGYHVYEWHIGTKSSFDFIDVSFNQPIFVNTYRTWYGYFNQIYSQETASGLLSIRSLVSPDERWVEDILKTDDPAVSVGQSIEAQFHHLVTLWRNQKGPTSFVAEMVEHPAYQEIIKMGPPVIPLLLRELEQRPDHWFTALRAITEVNPVRPGQRGKMREMAQAWLKWGKEAGYRW